MAGRFDRTLEDIDRRCRAHQIPHVIIGGIAANLHGYLRVTADVDVTILDGIDNLEKILRVFADDYIALKPNPLAFFQRCLFVPLPYKTTGIKVDVAAASSGFERLAVKRGQRLLYNKVEIDICTIEDLIIMKLVGARPKDMGDLQVLVPKNRKKLEVRYLRARAKEFIAVERGDVPEKLEEVLKIPKPRRSK
ncbi:MAG: hypothetical protein ONB46_04040 [candidate division KSB1 bacterium]|nr:hypothetical protein [candidate division KSB1 bacterium]MDZ7365210.1 hypothetical protein [candidate division KSB1 bacterium]MDZ7406948.1 hypothetical protein [candidate division KSB1 bacterium]